MPFRWKNRRSAIVVLWKLLLLSRKDSILCANRRSLPRREIFLLVSSSDFLFILWAMGWSSIHCYIVKDLDLLCFDSSLLKSSACFFHRNFSRGFECSQSISEPTFQVLEPITIDYMHRKLALKASVVVSLRENRDAISTRESNSAWKIVPKSYLKRIQIFFFPYTSLCLWWNRFWNRIQTRFSEKQR